jgi:hypothetical protein
VFCTGTCVPLPVGTSTTGLASRFAAFSSGCTVLADAFVAKLVVDVSFWASQELEVEVSVSPNSACALVR